MNYLTDGSFESLLCTLYHIFKNRVTPERIITPLCPECLDLFNDHFTAPVSEVIFHEIYSHIEQSISCDSLNKIYYVYLSELPHSSMLIYDYIRMGWTLKNRLQHFQTDDTVQEIHRIYFRVSKEAHRMNGYVRFKETADKYYYASIRTDHNVLPIIGKHFSKRMKGEKWIIHDTLRELAVLDLGKGCCISSFNIEEKILFSHNEEHYGRLWNNYFNNIAILERKNPRLQRQYIPKRYFLHMTELMKGQL